MTSLPRNSKILFQSPLYLVDLFIEVIRERFRRPDTEAPNQVSGWQWVDDFKKTTIFIESGLAEDREEFNTRPAIFINRLQTVSDDLTIANFAGKDQPTNFNAYHTTETSSFQLDCISKKQGESVILADLVHKHLLGAKHIIRKEFLIRSISNPVIGSTRPLQRDTNQFVTSVTFTAGVDMVWATYDVGPVLRRFRTKLEEDGSILILNDSKTITSGLPLGSDNDLEHK